jgi:predicted dinucleotide-binding enzyme
MSHRNAVPLLALIGAVCGVLGMGVRAETIAVIGTGQVGSALGQRLARLGHDVVYGSRDTQRGDVRELVARTGVRATAATQLESVRDADIVILALPWDAVEEVTRGLGDLAGVIVIDPTNPRITAADGLRDYAFDDSNAERIQALVPSALVVKAFNTLGAETMLDPESAGGPVTIPLVGDDVEAKAVVAGLVESMGLVPLDVGPLRYARILEGLHYLRYNAGQIGGQSFNYYLRPESRE